MRYALFFTPPANHDLTRIAAQWLGRDAYSGTVYEQQARGVLSVGRITELTTAPRRYGFHATLKAPFHLSATQNESRFIKALEQFAQNRDAFAMPKLKVGRLGHFFALVPDSNASELNQYAADVVRHFDAFRAPLTEADYVRRNPDRLEELQRTYLHQWGYPYIFDAFRFHMTLTGAVPEAEADQMEAVLKSVFDPLLLAPLMCGHVTLFCEAEKGAPFTVRTAIPFGPPDLAASSPTTKAKTL